MSNGNNMIAITTMHSAASSKETREAGSAAPRRAAGRIAGIVDCAALTLCLRAASGTIAAPKRRK
jgi:hypothetical protein